jgi:putative glutamine amidotransferase
MLENSSSIRLRFAENGDLSRSTSAMKPVIGITAGRRSDDRYPDQLNRIDISVYYSNAVSRAGGTPIILPPNPGSEADVLNIVDGLIFSGGSDLDPKLFGDNTLHPDTYGIDHDRDGFELALAALAWDADVPVLGICRGIQSLNVAFGGTLHQHVPDVSPDIEHRQQVTGIVSYDPAHPVSIAPGSRVAEVYGGTSVETNSFHHQAIKDVADRFTPVAWSADGMIEAVEAAGRSCFFALQWHPEMMVGHRDEQLAPFEQLVEFARLHRLAGAAD